MRRFLRTTLCVMAALLFLSRICAAQESGPERIVIGGGMPFGFSFGAAGAVCGAWNAAVDEVPCFTVANADSARNLRALESGAVDFAFVQSDWLQHAVEGTSRFRSDGANEDLRAVFSLPGEALTVLAPRALGAENIKHIDGRKVGFGAPRTYARLLMSVAARDAGIDLQTPEAGEESIAGDDAAALCAGEIDVLATVAAHPSGTVAGLMAQCALVLLRIEARVAKSILRKRPDLAEEIIPAGVYGAKQPEVRTVGLRTVLATLRGTPEDTVRKLVRAVFERLDALKRGHPGLGSQTPESMVAAGIAAPLHDGAGAYYAEQGWR